MNAGLSRNKGLISRSCSHPHHGYCYKGKALKEKVEGGEHREGRGREEFSGQANRTSVTKMAMREPV